MPSKKYRVDLNVEEMAVLQSGVYYIIVYLVVLQSSV